MQYLSFDPDQDADGNGLRDDIDGASTLANVAATFTNWVGNADKLLVYLTDHGSSTGGAGQMRLNSGEVLTAVQLDTWLDALQDAHQTEVVLVLDFCYSGSFLDELTYHGPAQRLVFSSTRADELTYFIAGGQVSFSSAFFGAVYQGFDLFQSFRLAEDAMSRYQAGQLDDTRDGLYQPGVDGAVARGLTAGASFIVGRDFPLINGVFPSTTHATGDPLRIWAAEISSAYPLQRVWATITPPGYNPDPGDGIPVLTLPEVDLRFNPDTQRHEADLAGLTEPGSYQLLFYAQDIWGGVSLPRQSVIVQTGFDERIVLLVGGPSNAPGLASQTNLAARAHSVFRTRGFGESSIHYLSPLPQDLDGNGTNETDGVAAFPRLDTLFTQELGLADRLTVMILGTATNGLLRLDEETTLSPAQLDAWLDAFQLADKPVHVFLDFDDSGSWLAALPAPTNRFRVVVASTQPGRPALMEPNLGFTSFLLSGLLAGKTIGLAVEDARRTLRRASGNLRQNARMDDNGNGIGNEKNRDGLRAGTAYLGAAFLTGEDRPLIGGVSPPVTLTNLNQAIVWAGPVTDADGISNVWAWVTAPTNSLPEPARRIDLAYHPGLDRYEGLLTGLDAPGVHTLTFFARDTVGEESEGMQTSVEIVGAASPPPDPIQPDAFEPDDAAGLASIRDLPLLQTHTLHVSSDEDWVRFRGDPALVYDIETVHSGTNLDTRIELFRELPDGSLLLIDTVDEFGYAQGELAGLDHPSEGFYLVRITHDPAYPHTAGAYTLVIHVPSGFTGITVTARNIATQGPLAGAVAHLFTSAGVLIQSLAVDGAGVAKFVQPAGDYRVGVTPPPGVVALFDPANASNVPENPNSSYGNARNLASSGFGTLSYGANAGSAAAYLGYYFLPGISVTGRVVDAVTHEPLTQVSLNLVRPADNAFFDRYPWAAYGAPWKTAAGAFPPRLILPPGSEYTLSLSLAGFTNRAQILTTPATGTLDLGRLTLGATDSDLDGLPDAWEQEHFGSLGQLPSGNPDGDTFTNAEEFQAGTRPALLASELRMAQPRVEGETLRLSWPASPGRRYTLWSAPTPSGPWSLRAVFSPPVVIEGQASWQEPLPNEPRFYRVDGTFLP